VGITPPPGIGGYRARVRLFRAAHGSNGREPRADASIDVTASLPPAPEEGIVSATVTLRVDAVARPLGSLDAPVAAAPRAAEALPVWGSAQRVLCTGAPTSNEVCIPGGAFWMGNPLLTAFHAPGDSVVMRIVALAPFFLDDREVRVDRIREGNVATADDPMRHTPDDGAPGPVIHGTNTDVAGNDEDLPVNCVSWTRAREYCATRGADLPTEAQLQYAASGLEGRLYPWGEDSPECADAVYARAPHILDLEHVCPGHWVLPGGSGERDRIALGDGTVLDLAGNVSEMTLDLWNLQTESCWGTGVFFDPMCASPSADPNANGQHTVVAGSFLDPAGAVAAATRRPAFSFVRAKAAGAAGGIYASEFAGIGFRCARSASL
jgi:formylglycine-generating enzyme required for sulfatase activity